MGAYDTTIGTLLLGIFFNTYLYGLVSYQFAAYYRTKFNDRLVTKYMVLLLFLLDTFHTMAAIYMAWYYTVQNYGNPEVLELGLWPYQFTPIGTAATALVTQLYLGLRIWCLTDSKFLYGVVVSLAIPSFIMGVTCTIEASMIDILSDLPKITPLVIAWLTTQVVVDTFITGTLIIIFWRWRGGFRRTDSVLNRLIRGAIQTGLFAGIFSLGDLLTFAILPNTNLYGMFAIPIGRIYTNTLMDTLLTRETIKTELVCTYDFNGGSGLAWSPPNDSQGASSTQSASVQVQAEKGIQGSQDPVSYTEGKTPSLVV